jgi:transposase
LQAVPDDSSDAAECGLEEQSLTRRQVHDLPPLRLLVTEHRALCRTCPQCQQPNRGHFPDNVKKPVQYGPQIQGLCVYLQTYQLLPSARTCQLLRDVFACSLSEGTLANIQADCHERLAPVEEAIRAGIGGAEVVHFDETGMRAQGRLHWMHSASTPKLTYYANHAKRGRLALDAHGLLSQFKGTAVHDSFASYFGYDTCKHALCNAHLLRELIAVYEQGQEQDKAEAGKAEADKAEAINAETGKQAWAGAMVTLLCEIKKTIEAAQAIGRSSLLPEEQDAFKARYQALLEQGRKSNPPPGVSPVVCGPKKRGRIKQTSAQNLLHRLSRYQSEVLRFMSDWSVPFDNNLAERDLRMVKVRQKVSGCFRSAQGAAQFCRVRGVISTLRKQGYSLLAALQSIFVGDTCWPALLT